MFYYTLQKPLFATVVDLYKICQQLDDLIICSIGREGTKYEEQYVAFGASMMSCSS